MQLVTREMKVEVLVDLMTVDPLSVFKKWMDNVTQLNHHLQIVV